MSDRLHILIYDVVGDSWDGVTAKEVMQTLQEYGSVAEIDVSINSVGGNVFDGMSIYDALVQHRAQVNVSVQGAALSIASIIAQAGDTRTIATGGLMMVHDPMTFSAGNAEDMRKTAQYLDGVAGQMAAIYAARSGTEESQWLDLMAEETWFMARQAVQAGLVDRVVDAKTRPEPVEAFAHAGFPKGVLNSAAAVRAAFEARAQTPTTTALAIEVPDRQLVVPGAQFPPVTDPTRTGNGPSTPAPMADDNKGTSLWNRTKQLLGITSSDDFEAMDEARSIAAKAKRVTEVEAKNTELTTQLDAANEAKATAEDRVAELEAAEDERILDRAVAEFRIPKAERETYATQMAEDREGTRTLLAALPKGGHNPSKGGPSAPDASGADGQDIQISREDARDTAKYRKARAQAKERGVQVVVLD